MKHEKKRILVVEDDQALRSAVARVCTELASEVRTADSVEAALEALDEWLPDLILLDVRLPDGSGVDVAKAAGTKSPSPAIVVMSGEASAEEAFVLAGLGTRSYLAKPFTLAQIEEAIGVALTTAPDLGPIVKASVSKKSLQAVQTEIREIMLAEALSLAEQNRSRAGRLLGVSRQAVHQLLRAPRERQNPETDE